LLTVKDCADKAEMEFVLKQTSEQQLINQEDTLWEVRLAIKYEDYPTFAHSVRVHCFLI
jgi:hypothetical protein